MIDVINKLNDKIKQTQKSIPNEGYVNGEFPTYSDCYPCLSDFSSRYWQKLWHKERAIEYFKQGTLWVSNQLFVSTTIAKKVGKIYFDLDFYSLIESISIVLDIPVENDTLIVELNNEIIHSEIVNGDLIHIVFNHITMLGDYLTVYLESESQGVIQIKYRIIG
jgi:hypothetical protein